MSNSEPRTQIHNDHNVYILGAGFSVEAGLPLIKNFMNRMRDAAAWLQSKRERKEEARAIDRVLQFRLQAAGAAYRVPLDVDNVEELFSLASASGDDALAQAMTLAIAATLDFARADAGPASDDRCYNIGRRNASDFHRPPNWREPTSPDLMKNRDRADEEWYSCPRYEFYLGAAAGFFYPGKKDRRDTFISFNYDTIVEDALSGLGIEFEYGDANRIQLHSTQDVATSAPLFYRPRVLKLHGSVNWVDKVAYALGPTPRESIDSRKLKDIEDCIVAFSGYHELREAGYAPLLVAPTWQKVFSGHLAAVWKDAVSALQSATRIIVLGYSIPATDQHFKYLLAAGLRDNISLRKIFFVNPGLADEVMGAQLDERLFSIFRREHFERGIIEKVPMNVREFLGPSMAGMAETGRRRIDRMMNPPGQGYNDVRWVGHGFSELTE